MKQWEWWLEKSISRHSNLFLFNSPGRKWIPHYDCMQSENFTYSFHLQVGWLQVQSNRIKLCEMKEKQEFLKVWSSVVFLSILRYLINNTVKYKTNMKISPRAW